MKNEILLKTSIEVAHIRKVSKFFRNLFPALADLIVPGITSLEIQSFCVDLMAKHDVQPAILGYNGFPAPVCISINHVLTHGIPRDQRLEEGDMVTVDSAVVSGNWFSDSAWTFLCGGQGDESSRRLLKSAWQATREGIEKARAGSRMGDIGEAVEKTAAGYGCSVCREFVGHGVGFDLHEEPSVPYFGTAGTGLPVVPGMVITIEPIVTLGSGESKTLHDGWTVVTVDGSLSAQFEQTIAVFGQYTEILTLSKEYTDPLPDYPPF